MTRKDFCAIAETVCRMAIDDTARAAVAKGLADKFATLYARFDSKRFIAACCATPRAV